MNERKNLLVMTFIITWILFGAKFVGFVNRVEWFLRGILVAYTPTFTCVLSFKSLVCFAVVDVGIWPRNARP